MKCPNCKEKNLVMSERKGIEIDYCPDCRGVWLDRGELDKIIEASLADTKAQPREAEQVHQGQPHFESRSTPHYKYGKRRKSFLEELFD